MLGKWQPHLEYRQYIAHKLKMRWPVYLQSIVSYKDGIKKVWLLNLDELQGEINPCYALTGRPAENQPEILRSLVMEGFECHEDSVDSWVERLRTTTSWRLSVVLSPERPPAWVPIMTSWIASG